MRVSITSSPAIRSCAHSLRWVRVPAPGYHFTGSDEDAALRMRGRVVYAKSTAAVCSREVMHDGACPALCPHVASTGLK